MVEILDPEDHAIGRVERAADAGGGKGVWREDVALAKPIAIDELVWHRLRYRFSYAGSQDAIAEDTESISQILRMPVLRVIGQQSYFAGGDAAVRVIVTDSKNQPVEGPSRVRVEIAPPGSRHASYSPARSTAAARPRRSSACRRDWWAVTRCATRWIRRSARPNSPKRCGWKRRRRFCLRPRSRSISRARRFTRARWRSTAANHQASANRPLTFELEDSRGNKVFKKATQTDRFGVASADFTLADEVNLGAYHLRANGAEITVNVDRYVLPKFKVAVDFASDGAPRATVIVLATM